MRNAYIDIGRYFFLFLIVIIHVPMLGGVFLFPLARCAVPFFFIIAGFYCYSNDIQLFETMLKRNVTKWLRLWVKYIILLFAIAFFANSFNGENIYFIGDMLQFIKEGSCRINDVIIYEKKEYGISTLWFLYSGILSFLLIYLCRFLLQKKTTLIVTAFLFYALITLNYIEQSLPRFLFIGTPFILIGMLLRKHEKKLHLNIVPATLLLLSCLCVSYIEFIVNFTMNDQFNTSTQVFLTTPLLSIAVIYFLLSMNKKFPLNKHIPKAQTLDIFIWHRLCYFILIILGLKNYMCCLDAFIVFGVTFLASTIKIILINKTKYLFTRAFP